MSRDRSKPVVEGKPHWLTRTKRVRRPEHMLFLDTETFVYSSDEDTEYHKFRIGWTCYLRRRGYGQRNTEVWKLHKTPESVCEEIRQRSPKGKTLYVYASNPNFDLWVTGFYWYMYEKGFRPTFVVDDGMTFILVVTDGERKVVVTAVQNYWIASVERLGEMLNLPKLSVDYDTEDLDALVTYCKRDVEIIRDAMLAWIDYLDEHDLGDYRWTVAGQALEAYRHRFLTHPIRIHRFPEILALERDAYFGGRTECFHVGKLTDGPFVMVDVNSMYPFVMRRFFYPQRCVGYQVNPDAGEVYDQLQTRLVIARVTVRTEEPLYPYRQETRLVFPVGEFETVLCTGSLRLGFDRGDIIKVHEVAYYTKAPLFRAYVDSMYQQRLEHKRKGEVVKENVCKRLLNSLYGRFAIAPPREIRKVEVDSPLMLRWSEYDDLTGELVTHTQLMGVRFTHQGRVEGYHASPAVASHVTDYARLYLYSLFERVGLDKVIYCDTDSLIIRKRDLEPLKPLLDDERLGGLSIEREADSIEIHGLKDYKFGQVVKMKGVRRGSRQVGRSTYEVEIWPHLTSLMRMVWLDANVALPILPYDEDGKVEMQKLGLYPIKRTTKRLLRRYYKGDVKESGDVVPLIVGSVF